MRAPGALPQSNTRNHHCRSCPSHAHWRFAPAPRRQLSYSTTASGAADRQGCGPRACRSCLAPTTVVATCQQRSRCHLEKNPAQMTKLGVAAHSAAKSSTCSGLTVCEKPGSLLATSGSSSIAPSIRSAQMRGRPWAANQSRNSWPRAVPQSPGVPVLPHSFEYLPHQP